ncbi:unknown protein [Simkania negevensis Z]|uniref:Uncharacterized protein n=1 Tax=Simkania negevensis (strain ATCC VR-1471 / DSM 27360 / Z) TaxID=331113 RepID=F8L8U2_SIMNZ|nr:unknown protein [Simkania negevensis Z]
MLEEEGQYFLARGDRNAAGYLRALRDKADQIQAELELESILRRG